MLDDKTFSLPERETKDFEPLPVGAYHAELIDIEQRDGTDFQGNPAKQLSFTFAVIQDGEFYGRRLWANASEKMVGGTKPSNLFRILTGITGKSFSKEECANAHEWLNASFLNSFIGTQKLLAVSQKPKQMGGMKNVIESILPVSTNLPPFNPDKVIKV